VAPIQLLTPGSFGCQTPPTAGINHAFASAPGPEALESSGRHITDQKGSVASAVAPVLGITPACAGTAMDATETRATEANNFFMSFPL
jgi:hypothetical protein